MWGNVALSLGQPQPQQPNILNEDAAVNRGAPPTLGDPISGPAQLMSTFWSSFGPGIIASGANLMRQAQSAAAASAAPSQTFDSPAPSRMNPHQQSVIDRRRQLEAELAALQEGVQPYDLGSPLPSQSVSVPTTSAPYSHASRNNSDEYGLRDRSGSGKFEKVEVPSDTEGNDDPGHGQPGSVARSTSWFGWGAGAGSEPERVKND